MKASLNEPDPREALGGRALMEGLHQVTPDATVLHRRIDSDWPQSCDRIAFVENITPDNATIELSHNTVKFRMRKHPG
jgi:hypothetical protein